jgi:hypothetical protein
MPYVTCPTCGERGKIPSSLIGARIKCRKCGLSFQVSPPAAAKQPAATAHAGAATAPASAGPSAAVEAQGIEVEGLDASSWAIPTEAAPSFKLEPDHSADSGHVSPSSFTSAPPSSDAAREYKLVTSRDKNFEGKFDLARLEEALNAYARQGWVAKSMLAPHLKGYGGVLEEVVVVLLERSREGG